MATSLDQWYIYNQTPWGFIKYNEDRIGYRRTVNPKCTQRVITEELRGLRGFGDAFVKQIAKGNHFTTQETKHILP